MTENRYSHIQRLFNSLYSYFKIPLQLRKGRNILVETRNIPASFSYSRQTENSLYAFDSGNMKIIVSSAGEAFADLYLDKDNLAIVSCKCQLIDIAPLRYGDKKLNHIVPMCSVTEFTAFCALLYNYFALECTDELSAHLAASIHMIFNSAEIYVHQTESGRSEHFEEFSTPYNMMKYDWVELEHVRRGDVKELIKLLKDEKRKQLTKAFFSSVPVIQDSIDYKLPLLVQFVGENGGNLEKAMTMYQKYKNARTSIKDIKSGTELYNNMLMDYCNIISSAIKKRYSVKVQNTLTYIHNNWKNKTDIDDMCRKLDVSRAYMMKLFKKETGCTIGDYITNIRMNYVKYMLIYTREPVSHIAAEAGYSNQSYMAAVFKDRFGMTPLEYQKNHFTITLSGPSGV